MKRMLLALAIGFFAASPTLATGGLVCRTAGPEPIEAAVVIGHTAVSSVVSARLSDNSRDVPVVVAQSWLEPNEVRVDLTDKNATRHELRLRAKRNGRFYDGSIWRSGARRWVRCRES